MLNDITCATHSTHRDLTVTGRNNFIIERLNSTIDNLLQLLLCDLEVDQHDASLQNIKMIHHFGGCSCVFYTI